MNWLQKGLKFSIQIKKTGRKSKISKKKYLNTRGDVKNACSAVNALVALIKLNKSVDRLEDLSNKISIKKKKGLIASNMAFFGYPSIEITSFRSS